MAQPKLTVAVAANMQYTIQELIAEYNKTEKQRSMWCWDHRVSLRNKILNGAPFDIFISADKDFLKNWPAVISPPEPPKVYAQGLLVLWSVKPAIQPAKGPEAADQHKYQKHRHCQSENGALWQCCGIYS